MNAGRLVLSALSLVAVVGTAGCGDDGGGDAEVDAAVDAPGVDTGMDGFIIPDGARRCETDEDCSDSIDCTRDICDDRGVCRNPTDFAMCDDGIFCNGIEICDPLRGCGPGAPETCNDDDVCTLDMCDEEEKMCRHSARDFDMDGEADWHCEGGTDCDDRDPARGSTVSEICDDGVDNDCDEMVDEPDCGRPMYDACDDPLDVSAGGLFTITTAGALSDYSLTCGGTGRKDVVMRLTLTEAHDLRVAADGDSVTYVALRTDCTDRATEVECASGFPGQIRARSLEPGTYFIIVADLAGTVIDVDVELTDPTPPPANETCATPIDVSAGGRFTGTMLDVHDDITTACGTGAAPDLVYSFTLTERKNVTASVVSSTGDTMSFAVRSTCDDRGTEIRCARGAPARSVVYNLAPGTYYLIVEGPSFREVDFTLDVSFSAPTPPPPGDTCASPIPLTLGTPTLGTLTDMQDDLTLTCSFYNIDAVYSFELTARSDVTVTVDGGGSYMFSSVRTDCLGMMPDLRCTSGNPARARLRDLAAGTYYVVVESFSPTGFTITVDATAPTVPVPVTGNDNCATAHVVPATGGLFTGDTTTMINDYTTATCGSMARSNDAVFRVDLSAMKHVVASTDGSTFDTVLHMHMGTCTSGAEMACDDDGGDGSASLLDRTLAPGTYYYVVDGWGTSSVGPYTFEVIISDP